MEIRERAERETHCQDKGPWRGSKLGCLGGRWEVRGAGRKGAVCQGCDKKLEFQTGEDLGQISHS